MFPSVSPEVLPWREFRKQDWGSGYLHSGGKLYFHKNKCEIGSWGALGCRFCHKGPWAALERRSHRSHGLGSQEAEGRAGVLRGRSWRSPGNGPCERGGSEGGGGELNRFVEDRAGPVLSPWYHRHSVH